MHLDESCLGNGKPGDNPGGAGGLVEIRTSAGLQRREFYLHSKATTNNRMALASAIAALQLLGQKKNRLRLLVISGLAIGATVAVLFLEELAGLNLQRVAAATFLAAIALLMWAMLLLLRETQLAAAQLRIPRAYLELERNI